GRTSVRGLESGDRKGKEVGVQADIGHNYCAVWLNQGLSTEAMSTISGGRARPPRQSPIGGGTHLLKVALRSIVVLGITVAIMGAARGIIADRPVFVVEIPWSIHHHGRTPDQSTISRAAHHHIDRTIDILNAKP